MIRFCLLIMAYIQLLMRFNNIIKINVTRIDMENIHSIQS
ncbi:hypothetical protein SAMN02799630_03360 [Paenibacillus sp. UNCCL117]|nr:hypothetical protein SAMN04488602_12832 [Paenibacillus sp. cl123]SFW46073.1 hypothetical protein SAMN02799630_03360 [Paenibacillus sp. UNCCL117]